MREANRVRERTAARDLAVLPAALPAASCRRVALDLLRADTTRKATLPTGRKPAARDDAYMAARLPA